MINYSKALISIFIFSLILACNGQAKEQDKTDQRASNSTSEANSNLTETDQGSQPTKGIEQIVYAYLDLKSALVASDVQQIAKAAEALAEEIDAENEELKEVNTLAATIAENDDIELQRKTFYALSEDLYAYLKENPIEGLTLYRQFCPMAFNNDGAYWLSDSEEIRNPYFGDKMLKCGKVEEKL